MLSLSLLRRVHVCSDRLYSINTCKLYGLENVSYSNKENIQTCALIWCGKMFVIHVNRSRKWKILTLPRGLKFDHIGGTKTCNTQCLWNAQLESYCFQYEIIIKHLYVNFKRCSRAAFYNKSQAVDLVIRITAYNENLW